MLSQMQRTLTGELLDFRCPDQLNHNLGVSEARVMGRSEKLEVIVLCS